MSTAAFLILGWVLGFLYARFSDYMWRHKYWPYGGAKKQTVPKLDPDSYRTSQRPLNKATYE